MRTCFHCKHLNFSEGEQALSDDTPGCPAEVSCLRRMFQNQTDPGSNFIRVTLIEAAVACPGFESDEQ